jgi:hypothetical protein
MLKSKLLLGLSSVLITTVVAEVVLQLLSVDVAEARSHNPYYDRADPRWNTPDPELGFVRKPLIDWTGQATLDPQSPEVRYRTDENGFRNPPGIRSAEVVFVGDSFTEGGNVAENQTFVRMVGSKQKVTAVNLGRAWYGPQQEALVLERFALEYRPRTLVWVLFEGNDVADAEGYETYQRTKHSTQDVDPKLSSSGSLRQWIKGRKLSGLLRSARKALQRRREGIRYEFELLGSFRRTEGLLEDVEFGYAYRPEVCRDYPLGWQATQAALQRGAEACRQRGVQLLVMLIPIKLRVLGPYTDFHDPQRLAEYLPERQFDQPGDLAQQLREFCREEGLPFVDALMRLREAAAAGQVVYSPRFDTHLDVAGHAVVANLVCDFLVEN